MIGIFISGHLVTVKALLDSGANPNIKNNQNKKPSQMAEDKNYTEIAAVLKEAEGKYVCGKGQ